MKVVPFIAAHGRAIAPQEFQSADRTDFTDEETLSALEKEHSFTAIGDDGGIIACAGLIDIPGWNGGRKFAWALLCANPGRRALLKLTRAIKQALAASTARRIETSVDCDFANGVIWAARLGFQYEGRMRAFGRDGRDHFLFARVNR